MTEIDLTCKNPNDFGYEVFDIDGGFLYSPYLNKTRTEEDFCRALEEVVSTDPNF